MRASYAKTNIMSIKEKAGFLWETHRQEIVFALIIFLVSSVSFGLGYLMAQENNRAPIIIEKRSQE